jgi:hypothetical protein
MHLPDAEFAGLRYSITLPFVIRDFEARFQRKLEHSSTLLLAHAVHFEYFDLPEVDREFDFGWAGQIARPFTRSALRGFQSWRPDSAPNDWSESHNIEGVAWCLPAFPHRRQYWS